MRNIEFRGQSVKNKEWVYGDLVRIPKDLGSYSEPPSLELKTCITDKNSLSKNPIEVIPETVGQFISRLNKNKEKIWEGDIVRYKFWTGEMRSQDDEKYEQHISEIVFKDGQFSPRPRIDECDDCWYSWGYYDFEKIGNIFENPELLEEK